MADGIGRIFGPPRTLQPSYTNHGIDPGGAARGDVAARQRNQRQEHRHATEEARPEQPLPSGARLRGNDSWAASPAGRGLG